MAELAPGQTLDQYELSDVIARSGMATIFRARDLENGQTVVLKVPHMQFEADLVFHERFLREEQIGQRLDHPAIIKVLKPKQKRRVYLAMEYVEGELLSERMRRERGMPIATALGLALQIADALVYLHSHSVVHRDLKPENVMIMPNGKVKLMDFGIALDTTLRKMTWAGLSSTMGTPDYMAPEQVKGLRGDARTDIYSLGAMLYEMLTGAVPFPGDNVYATMRAKVREDPTPPRRLRHEISPEIEEIILRALERDARNRFESALEFREALAHPESVVLTDRAGRARSKSSAPHWQRTTLTLIAGLAAFAVLFWVVSRVGSWAVQMRERPTGAAPASSASGR
jgi:serine/threonine protein kinase